MALPGLPGDLHAEDSGGSQVRVLLRWPQARVARQREGGGVSAASILVHVLVALPFLIVSWGGIFFAWWFTR